MVVPNDTAAAKPITYDAGKLSDSVAMASKGEHSYSGENSEYQGIGSALFQSLIVDNIQKAEWVSDATGTVRVADFGCSIGQNTIRNVTLIVDSVRQRPSKTGFEPEVSAFFVDLPSNDFNCLFQELVDTVVGKPGEYFMAGVPGSFYNRLFPKSFLHVGYSSVALHWLSKIPDVVREKDSPAYSGRTIQAQVAGACQATVGAFSAQSRADLTAFLDARYEELVPGGLLILVIQTIATAHEKTPLFEDCNTAWNELTEEGVIDEETTSKFNMPVFFPSVEEVQNVLDNFSSKFYLHHLKTISGTKANPVSDSILADPFALSTLVRKAVYSTSGPYYEKCVGVDLATKIFDRIQRNLTVVFEDLWSSTGDVEVMKRRILGGPDFTILSLVKKK